ncbi:MAG TPA: prephenate dehydratase domain-containing protein [Polyangiaceae bacterium]|nr:prephenate dehydratase domain-containing protein [Polyangiaceae bacterium]
MPDTKRRLQELRGQIYELDLGLLKALEARAVLSREAKQLLEGQPPVADRGEREAIEALEAASAGVLPEGAIRSIFSEIHAVARGIEQPVRIAYLGPEGGFSHAVAQHQFGPGASFLESVTVADALDEVVRGRAAFAVFPFESSIEGLVQASVNALEPTELVLVAQRSMAATYDLMSRAASLSDVNKVFATAAAHAACERFLEAQLPQVTIVDVRSPVAAAEQALGDETSAALVPEDSGRAAGLSVLQANVGDSADMHFRYGVAGARPASRTGTDTTCLLFNVDDTPGALYDVLRHFAERGINLKKLQSRPVASRGLDYLFYVEVSGHITDRPVVTALESVKRHTKYLRVLGSFAS